MKIRNHKKRNWVFYPHQNSKLKKNSYVFKYKSDLMKFLQKNLGNSINGIVDLEERGFGYYSSCIRSYVVWYNLVAYCQGQNAKPVLKQLKSRVRGKTKRKVSKKDKKYFAFSDKIINLMCDISDTELTKQKAKRLVTLFEKRGYKEFIPNNEDREYIQYYLDNGIDFHHWSDRCGTLRMRTVIEYLIKQEML